MVSGALSSRGAEATVKRAEEIGSLPSFRSSWCRDIPLVAQLRKKEGNEDLTLKALFAIANDGRKAFPTTKKGAVSFLSVIEGGKDITEIAVEVEAEKSKQAKAKKARGAGKQTADEKKAGKGKVNEQMSALIKALNEPKVGKLNLILVDELLELCTAILIEAEQAAA